MDKAIPDIAPIAYIVQIVYADNGNLVTKSPFYLMNDLGGFT